MLPARKRKGQEEVPAKAKEKLELALLEDIDDAVKLP